MSYRLLAVDLDGTLLDPYLKISKRNLQVVKTAIEQGVTVTLSTGRMFAAALPFARQLQLDVPLITCNGAAVICSQTKKVYYERSLPRELVLAVIKMARKMRVEVSLYSVDDIFVENIKHNARIHGDIDNAEVKRADLEEVVQTSNIIKVLFSSDNLYEDTEKIYHEFGQLSTFYFSLPWFVEIVAEGVNKGDALKEVAGRYRINSGEIIAIGDNFNDLPMLEYAGLGVAMGNAPGDIKSMADYVTASHDDDGVARVIEKFILKQPSYP